MAEDFTKTVRIKRPARIAQDERGNNVWVGPVETAELELVSTTMLQTLLHADDGRTRREIRQLVAGGQDGVLARDTATGVFQIVSDADLMAALAAMESAQPQKRSAEITAAPISEQTRRAADELSLASTQVLRKVLTPDGKTSYQTPKSGKKDKSGGFNPYDNN